MFMIRWVMVNLVTKDVQQRHTSFVSLKVTKGHAPMHEHKVLGRPERFR